MSNEETRVYVSGKITDLPEDVFHRNFEQACELLKLHGFTPVNPVEVRPGCGGACESKDVFDNGDYKHTWQCYMRHDLMELLNCHAIFAMENAARSKGALLEIQIAMSLGMPVITSSNGKDLDW